MNKVRAHFVWSAALRTKRQLKIIQELNKENYEVFLYAMRRDELLDVLPEGLVNDVKVHFIDTGLKLGEGYRGLFKRLLYGFQVVRLVRANHTGNDIIFVTDFDSAIFFLWRLGRSKFYFDIADFVETFDSKWGGIARGIIKSLYRPLYRKAEYIIVPDQNRFSNIPGEFLEKVVVINNAPIEVEAKKSLDLTLGPASAVRIFYYGGLSNDRGIDFLLSLSEKIKGIEVHVAGWGQCEDLVRQVAGIKFYGMLESSEVMYLLSQMDYSYVFYDPSFEHNRMASPNKLFEAIQSEIPLIVALNTSIDDVVSSYGIGECIPYDFKALAERIEFIIENKPTYSFSSVDKNKFSWSSSIDVIKQIFP